MCARWRDIRKKGIQIVNFDHTFCSLSEYVLTILKIPSKKYSISSRVVNVKEKMSTLLKTTLERHFANMKAFDN